MAEDSENSESTENEAAVLVTQPPPSNLPLIITLAALLIYFVFQTVQLLIERSNLSMAKSNQEGTLQEAQKIQSQFKTLITKTNELAQKGHAGARMVMEGLERQGLGGPPQSEPSKPPETKPAK